MKGRLLVLLTVLMGPLPLVRAETAAFKPRAVFHSFDDETTVVQLETVRRPDGGFAATIRKESVPLNTKTVEVMCDRFFAQKGEDGFWIMGRGETGRFAWETYLPEQMKKVRDVGKIGLE